MTDLFKHFCRRYSVAQQIRSPNKPLHKLTCTLFHNSYFTLSLSAILSLGLGAYAQAPVRSSSQGEDAAQHSRSKRARKYDIDRIGERGTGRGINVYSINRERALGQELANSIDHTSKFVEDGYVKEYVNDLGQRIVRNSDAQLPFAIKVLDSSDLGVFALPGGFLYVDRGLITALDAEAELASMMAHEIAHVAARHTTRELTRRRIVSVASTAAMFAGPVGVVVEDLSSIGGSLSRKKFDRDAEYEADLLGMEYAYAAGYDPDAFLSALEKVHARQVNMQDIYKKLPGYKLATKLPFHKQIATALSDYPPIEERIRHLQKEITTFLPKRDRYIVDSSDFEEVKARLLASEAPVLLRTHSGADTGKGPVLRRRQD
jgi:Zn-dependent protease with chaperone function